MDSGICRTSSGDFCKRGLKKGGKCSQHDGTPSPNKISSPKKGMLDLPCDLLLEIAKNLDPQDYLTMSLVSKKIDMCLSEGRFNTSKTDRDNLKKAKKEILQRELAAVIQNGLLIEFIENPSEKVQLAAVNQDGSAIRFIENPSEKVQLAAVRKDPYVIEFIKNPSEEVQLEAVSQDGFLIRFIKNPSEKVQLFAVREKKSAILFIKISSREVQMAARE